MDLLKVSERDEVELEIFTNLAVNRLMEEPFTPGERLNALFTNNTLDRIPLQIIDNTSRLIGRDIHDFFFDPIVRYKSLCAQIIRWGASMTETASRINSYKIGEGLGAKLKYSRNEAPSTAEYVLKEQDDFERPAIPELTPYVEKDIWLIRNIKQRFGELLGPPCCFLYPPFSWVATYLRDSNHLFIDIFDNPDFVHNLCRFAVDLELDLIDKLTEETNCTFFMPGGFSDILSPDQYREFALPYMADLINSDPESLFYISVPGDLALVSKIYDTMKNHKKIVCMGSSLSPNNPLKNFKELHRFCEALDALERPYQIAIDQTSMKMSCPEEIEDNVHKLIKAGNKANMIFRTDTLDPETPHQNIDTLVRAVKKYGAF